MHFQIEFKERITEYPREFSVLLATPSFQLNSFIFNKSTNCGNKTNIKTLNSQCLRDFSSFLLFRKRVASNRQQVHYFFKHQLKTENKCPETSHEADLLELEKGTFRIFLYSQINLIFHQERTSSFKSHAKGQCKCAILTVLGC